jgi:hypothetical protein
MTPKPIIYVVAPSLQRPLLKVTTTKKYAPIRDDEIMTDWHPLRSLEDATSNAWASRNEEAEARAKNAPRAKMPALDHLKIKDFEDVYEPSDDTVREEKKMHGELT